MMGPGNPNASSKLMSLTGVDDDLALRIDDRKAAQQGKRRYHETVLDRGIPWHLPFAVCRKTGDRARRSHAGAARLGGVPAAGLARCTDVLQRHKRRFHRSGVAARAGRAVGVTNARAVRVVGAHSTPARSRLCPGKVQLGRLASISQRTPLVPMPWAGSAKSMRMGSQSQSKLSAPLGLIVATSQGSSLPAHCPSGFPSPGVLSPSHNLGRARSEDRSQIEDLEVEFTRFKIDHALHAERRTRRESIISSGVRSGA